MYKELIVCVFFFRYQRKDQRLSEMHIGYSVRGLSRQESSKLYITFLFHTTHTILDKDMDT